MKLLTEGFFDIYFYRFPGNTSAKMIENYVSECQDVAKVYVRDISDNDAETKNKLINSIIISERSRIYDGDDMSDRYLHIIQYGRGKYIAIAAVLKSVGEDKVSELLKSIFGTTASTFLYSNESVNDSRVYWKGVSSKIVLSGRKDAATSFNPNKEEYLPFEIANTELFKTMLSTSPSRVKALMSCAMSKVICKSFKCGSIVFEDDHNGGKLSRFPVRFEDVNNLKVVDNMTDTFNDAYRFHNISYEEIADMIHVDLKTIIMYTQSFCPDNGFDVYIKSAKAGIVYKINALELTNSPLYIVYRPSAETPAVYYHYDAAFFKGKNITGIHKAFCALLDEYLQGRIVDIDFERYLTNRDEIEAKILKAKVNSLNMTGWFGKYSEADVKRLAEKCRLVRGISQQAFAESGKKITKICFILSGKVEIDGTDRKNKLNTLMILKKNDVFGLESLTDDCVTKVDYRTYSDDALLLVMDSDIFWQEAEKHPEIMRKVINIQSDRLYKFQRLWMIQ